MDPFSMVEGLPRENFTQRWNLTPVVNNHTASGHVTGHAVTVVIGIILGAIIFITLLGNSLVVLAVANFHRLRTVNNYPVVSLAVADIMVALLVMPCSVIYEVREKWTFGWIFCYFWISCDVTCCTASILHLCIISLDRYWAITKPLKYKSRMSTKRVLVMIAMVWLCSIAISFVPIYMGWFADQAHMDLYTDSSECGLQVNRVYAVISSMTSFYVPLVVMIIAYLKIFKIAQMQAREIKRLEESVKFSDHHSCRKLHRKSKKINKDAKAIKTLGTIMGLFCFSWIPFFVMYLLLPFCGSCSLPNEAISAITWLGYANSFINPCVYAFMNRDFRMAFRKILYCGCEACFRWVNKHRRRTNKDTRNHNDRPVAASFYENIRDTRNSSVGSVSYNAGDHVIKIPANSPSTSSSGRAVEFIGLEDPEGTTDTANQCLRL